MKYVLVSDLHGSYPVTLGLLSLLESRGWVRKASKDGHPYLYHDDETLIFCGDNSDRGSWSVPVAYLAMSSMFTPLVEGERQAAITLMGNHDYKILRYFHKGYDKGSYGFQNTLTQLQDPRFHKASGFLKNHIGDLPYWFVGKRFAAAHAFWEPPMPSEELAMYGPVVKEKGENSRGFMPRIRWWEEPNTTGRTVFFGHYHMMGEGLFLGHDRYCLDNHDGGVHVAAIFDDSKGATEIVHLNLSEDSLLYEQFEESLY